MGDKLDQSINKTPEQILENNPNVSKSVVSQYNELEKQLHKLGMDTKPCYTLSPPLGGNLFNLLNKLP